MLDSEIFYWNKIVFEKWPLQRRLLKLKSVVFDIDAQHLTEYHLAV